MKFGVNGALRIGTLNGAHAQICEEGDIENFALFALDAEQVREPRLRESHRPQEFVDKNTSLRKILGFVALGSIAEATPTYSARSCIAHGLKTDFWRWPTPDLCGLPEQVSALWRDLLDVDTQSDLSSDRSIREYGEKVWQVRPVRAPSWSTVTQTGYAHGLLV